MIFKAAAIGGWVNKVILLIVIHVLHQDHGTVCPQLHLLLFELLLVRDEQWATAARLLRLCARHRAKLLLRGARPAERLLRDVVVELPPDLLNTVLLSAGFGGIKITRGLICLIEKSF